MREIEKWCIHSKRLEKPHTRTHPPEKCSESVQRLRHSALPSRLRAPPSNPLPTLLLSRHPKSLAPLRSKVAHLSFLPLIPLYFLSSPRPPPLSSRGHLFSPTPSPSSSPSPSPSVLLGPLGSGALYTLAPFLPPPRSLRHLVPRFDRTGAAVLSSDAFERQFIALSTLLPCLHVLCCTLLPCLHALLALPTLLPCLHVLCCTPAALHLQSNRHTALPLGRHIGTVILLGIRLIHRGWMHTLLFFGAMPMWAQFDLEDAGKIKKKRHISDGALRV